jgi:adenosylmethionine-8-amino-7-oxononanoate aminotransferase
LRRKLESHPHVRDIRGRGFFGGIEFVKDKSMKEPFELSAGVAMGIHTPGMQDPHNISLYPGTGTVDGRLGDHGLIAPAYNIREGEWSDLIERVANVIIEYFETRDRDGDRDINASTNGVHNDVHKSDPTYDKEGPMMLP